jgi:hypothetical protein
MIVTTLHKEPTGLDTVLHRDLRLKFGTSVVSRLAPHSSFMVTVGEFAEVAREYPILFVTVPPDAQGRAQVTPVAVFGLVARENLFVKDGVWQGLYIPAMLRAYPFTMARVEGTERLAVVFDNSWEGFSRTEGAPLFDEKGEATEVLSNAHKFVQEIENDVERTRLAGLRLLELKLLKPMRFDATLGNGEKLSVDGFLTIDDEAFAKLSDKTLGELHRNGLLYVLHAHKLSLNNMRHLVERREKLAAPAAPAPPAAAAAAPGQAAAEEPK